MDICRFSSGETRVCIERKGGKSKVRTFHCYIQSRDLSADEANKRASNPSLSVLTCKSMDFARFKKVVVRSLYDQLLKVR